MKLDKILRKKFVCFFILLILALAAFYFFLRPSGPARKVSLSPGMSAGAVAMQLKEKGIIRSPAFFMKFINVIGKDRDIKAGTYFIRPGLNYFSLIEKLSSGDEYLLRVSIPEGFTTEQIAHRLYDNNIIEDADKFISEVEERKLRGFLFPETYYLAESMSAGAVIDVMVEQFNRVFTSDMDRRAEEMGYSVRDIVILASIIERETRVPDERPIISGIFHQRLEKQMFLESCATIQFALGENQPRLSYRDLNIDSPY
ncbi:MAG: endolytic transglycosylase MltG, partial [Elusimicrobiota bacterium]